MEDKCPVCGLVSASVIAAGGGVDAEKVSCTNCGTFFLTGSLYRTIGNYLKQLPVVGRILLAHHVRRMQRDDKKPSLGTDDVKRILATQSLPTLPEQIDNLILWAAARSPLSGTPFRIEPHTHCALVGCNEDGLFQVISEATHLEYLGETGQVLAPYVLRLKGWMRYEELQRGVVHSRKAFMAMPYGKPELNRVVEEHFVPAVAQTGFELYRLIDEPRAGLIDDHLRVEIRTSRFLVADLTHGNNGAYWEAGYAEGLGKPVIYTCRRTEFEDEKKRPHFDAYHRQTVVWEEHDILDACQRLKDTIRATLPSEAKLTDD